MSGGSEDIVVGVAEFNRRLRRAVEGASGSYWVEGEVGSLKRAVSGHSYFTLKDEDEDACVECVMYRFDALRAQRYLIEGAKIQLFGRATVWAPRGRLQFVAQRVRPAGRGGLLIALEALKKKLGAEGLFDAARKRPLPADPRVVGVVTSAAGAAFHDIRTVAFRRGGVRLVLSPALVQGEGAPESLLAALARIERYPGLDVVIIGRGGGSGEDLMAFNDESVVRRIASLRVPVVSAVGHEVDISLSDLVADARAATPSQAAELVVPDAEARRMALRRYSAALERGMRARLFGLRAEVDRGRARLGDPRLVVAERQRELDEFAARLFRRTERALKRRAQLTAALHSRLFANHPRSVIEKQRARLSPLGARLFGAMRLGFGRGREQLSAQAARLHALSPLAVLGRGYAIALARDGKVVRRASEAAVGDAISLRLGEGALDVEVRGVLDSEKEKDS
ncbi:MAG TPA: exodeoxyribonuclease VII large subunit [Polyangiaceae bacterium]|nr:exodeoxyribonuclease VII large subunit [Polyangiaceae bacterium]